MILPTPQIKFRYILAACALLSGCILFIMARSGCNAKKELKEVKEAAKLDAKPAIVYRDRDSIQHMEKQVEPVSTTTAGILYKSKWEKAAKELGVAKKRIEELTEINMELRGRLNVPITPVAPGDASAPMYATGAFSWADSTGDIVVNGYILQRPIDTACKGDSCLTETEAQLDYSVAITGKIGKYSKRKHRIKILGRELRFGKKIHFINVYTDNKNITITGLEHIQINH